MTISKKSLEFPRPITVKNLLEKDITPSKEEYNELKDLDKAKNVDKQSTIIAKKYVDAAESLNRYGIGYIDCI